MEEGRFNINIYKDKTYLEGGSQFFRIFFFVDPPKKASFNNSDFSVEVT